MKMVYEQTDALLLGGDWTDESYSGSWCMSWASDGFYSDSVLAVRNVCDHLNMVAKTK